VYSLPVIHTLHSSFGSDLRTLLSDEMTRADRLAAIDIVRNGPGVASALEVAERFVDEAKTVILDVATNDAGCALGAACDHLLESVAAVTA
jgi:geranylgeranyl pyrophosphate synthase